MSADRDKCIFCQICDGKKDDKILYQDEEYVVFVDIKPAAEHHYLVVPRQHIPDARSINADQKPMVQRLVEIGKQVLEEQGGDPTDCRIGFHWPPFISITHLHLHVIAPSSRMNFIPRMIFKENSWWFVSPNYLLSR